MAWLSFATLYKCLNTGKISSNFVSVLPKSLTLDPSYVAGYLWKSYRMLFGEIEVVPCEEALSAEAKAVFAMKTGSLRISKALFLRGLRQKLYNIVLKNWKPEIFHVHVHSSGLDSRMLSWIIKQIQRKYGNKWLGNVMFLCSKWEGSVFKKIMAYEGWNSNQYLVVDEQLKREEYYASSFLNFADVWRELNPPSCIPVNLMWYLTERAQKLGLVPEHVQLWTTQWGNTVFDSGSRPLDAGRAFKATWKLHYLSHIGACPKKTSDFVEPYTDLDLARFVISSSVRLGGKLRPMLLASMDRKLFQFRNIHAPGDRRRPISERIMKRIIIDYNKSWYGQNVKRNIVWKASTDYFSCWSHWTAASLCEHLLTNGYKIKIGNK